MRREKMRGRESWGGRGKTVPKSILGHSRARVSNSFSTSIWISMNNMTDPTLIMEKRFFLNCFNPNIKTPSS
jgi:hypothetical protein